MGWNNSTIDEVFLKFCTHIYGVVSSLLYIFQILVHSHFDLVSSLLALDVTVPVSEPVTQMAVELKTFISFQYSKSDKGKSYILFYLKTTTNESWNDAEIMLKSFSTSNLQIMNRQEPLF